MLTREGQQRVLDRAVYACQCTGTAPDGCGKGHPVVGDRQRCGSSPRSGRLAAVPADPEVPDHEAVRLDPKDLIAVCGGCYGRRRDLVARRRQEQEQQRLDELSEPLF